MAHLRAELVPLMVPLMTTRSAGVRGCLMPSAGGWGLSIPFWLADDMRRVKKHGRTTWDELKNRWELNPVPVRIRPSAPNIATIRGMSNVLCPMGTESIPCIYPYFYPYWSPSRLLRGGLQLAFGRVLTGPNMKPVL